MNSFNVIADDVRLGTNVRLAKFINLYGCEIGDDTKIGAFVEVQRNASIGKRCKISSHTFICEGVSIEDNVFIGHGVIFINDKYPRATAPNGKIKTDFDWTVERTIVKRGASIGSGATILSHVIIGEDALVAAGSTVTKDVPAGTIVAGNPARVKGIIPELQIATRTDPIPFLDLVTPHRELEEELVEVFRRCLHTASFVGGVVVERFETAFAAFCGVEYCVGVGSGTDALRFAIMAAGVDAGDVVITVPNTFIATAEAISQAGALPEFVDIDERTYNMDPEKLREYLEDRCALDEDSGRLIIRRSAKPVGAIIPVHLYGQMADMDPILELADRYHLMVIEDACQAHGAEHYSKTEMRWKRAGSMGRAAAFSFYPGKNLGACGEAGAVTTNDLELARKIQMLRDHGQAKKYYHDVEGYNGRLDAIQAGILTVKLKHLAEWNACRREAAAGYRELFAAAGIADLAPFELGWAHSVYHLYVIRVKDRGAFMKQMAETGIGTAIHYPVPLHLQKAYEALGYKVGDFPVAEKVAPEIVSLPMFPQLSKAQLKRVVESVVQFCTGESALSVGGSVRTTP